MIKSLLKIGVLLVIGILVYNYFLGTPEEKEQSKVIFTEVKDLGKSAWGLLEKEHTKFKAGKYDDALTKVEDLYTSIKEKAKVIKDSELLDKVTELEKKRQELEKEISRSEDQPDSYDNNKEIEQHWQNLMNETQSLVEDMDKKEKQ